MIGASLYIIVCSLRNRTRRWLKRVREPRYFTALVAGAAYFYFVVGGQVRRRGLPRRTRSGLPAPSLTEFLPALSAAGPLLAGIGVLVLAAGSWLFPGTGTLLDFTRPEVQFLFPAPVSRRTLIVHRMLRSQLGMLFGPLVFAVLVPFGSSPTRVRFAITLWMLLFTARAYFSGIALARARLTSREPRKRQLARLPLMLVLGALVLVAINIGRVLLAAPVVDTNDALVRVASATAHGLPYVALWPFVALIGPAFAPDWTQFVLALPGAVAVLSAVTAWVLFNDDAFEDITRDVADNQKDQQQDQARRRQTAYRARNVGWTLAPIGRAELAFAWKGAMQTFRVVSVRVLVRIVIFVVWVGAVVSMSSRGLAGSLGVFAMIVATMSTLLGPLVLRVDLRQDLQHLEVLKTWPVRAAALVRGEMLWPATLLTAIVWGMTGMALYLSTAVVSSASFVLRISTAAAVCLVAPALIAAQLAIHNAVALLFPAWISFGAWRARGVDAVGQRLIVVGGTLLTVALAAAPGALAGFIVWFAFSRFIGPVALVPAAALCASVIGVEVLLVTEALGPAYERLDVTSIEWTE